MKHVGKHTFFIVSVIILLLAYFSVFGLHYYWGDHTTTYIKGLKDVSWGIDIKGGVEATYVPTDSNNTTADELQAAKDVIEQRLVSYGITDSQVYVDTVKKRVVVQFPWSDKQQSMDANSLVDQLGKKAELTFRKGTDKDQSTGAPSGEVILSGNEIKSATAKSQQTNKYSNATEYVVSLEFSDSGKSKFADATKELAASKGRISIWLDNDLISAPTVNEEISDGQAIIQGNFTAQSANQLAKTINSGALPIDLKVDSFSTISPTLGMQARNIMLWAAVIAFVAVGIFMILRYRLPGCVATISLLGHIGATIALISGVFPIFSGFTLTLPGIAGIILGIGMGVDANVLTASRIKEELDAGHTIDGAINTGFKRGLTAVLDGNITVLIISIILMGAFGPTDSIFAILLKPFFFMFGATTEGTIYSFGYTMFVGFICNLLFGIISTRLMIKSLSKFKSLRKATYYGGEK